MAAAGAIAEPGAVFWLSWEEVEEAARLLDAGQPAECDGRPILLGLLQRRFFHRNALPLTALVSG